MSDPSVTFTPASGRVVCSAFSPVFKLISVMVVSLAAGWGWQMWTGGVLEMTMASSGWLGAALCMMIYTQWFILRGTTTMDATGLEQAWVWRKRVELTDLAYAKLIRVRGLEWLIAPRLYTKTFSHKLTVFYVTGTTMLVECERLENHLREARLNSI